ncbi:hypothetical protein [Deefgea salmonis]|uniref:Uncharacterized protein n=1 Tax=Deefgea salmonis TaxID=2875502 RepID=A0ABS8BP50_9NEIS|nr:hypothetical protein [Deefgea salmonis]MCB5197354.1 hypothetical protein [Deefgea salmonis]
MQNLLPELVQRKQSTLKKAFKGIDADPELTPIRGIKGDRHEIIGKIRRMYFRDQLSQHASSSASSGTTSELGFVSPLRNLNGKKLSSTVWQTYSVIKPALTRANSAAWPPFQLSALI